MCLIYQVPLGLICELKDLRASYIYVGFIYMCVFMCVYIYDHKFKVEW